jgi:hypothetical protein
MFFAGPSLQYPIGKNPIPPSEFLVLKKGDFEGSVLFKLFSKDKTGEHYHYLSQDDKGFQLTLYRRYRSFTFREPSINTGFEGKYLFIGTGITFSPDNKQPKISGSFYRDISAAKNALENQRV